MDNEAHQGTSRPDYLLLLHRWSGLIAAPFLMLSILLALGLTHTRLLDRLSEWLYDSFPIPQVALAEEVRPGSWDQALELAQRVTGAQGHVITSRDRDTIVVQAFMAHSHDSEVMKINPHTQVVIDTRTMRVIDIRDKHRSLVNMGHSVHAFRLLDLHYLSLALVSSLSLLILLITGFLLVWRQRHREQKYTGARLMHLRLGQVTALIVVVITVTTLDFEFDFLGQRDQLASHAIPAVSVAGPVQPGSVDQARNIVKQVTGKLPRGVYIRGNSGKAKFSEAGDGIGGLSVWMDIDTMAINRITDWRNDKQSLMFILHDGRWFGGMNAININDIIAVALLLLVLGGVKLYLVRKREVT